MLMQINAGVARVGDIAVGYLHAGADQSRIPYVFVHGRRVLIIYTIGFAAFTPEKLGRAG